VPIAPTTAVIRFAGQDNASRSWAAGPLERKPAKAVSVALANKTACIAWAILVHNQSYTAPAL
jgi:transposase